MTEALLSPGVLLRENDQTLLDAAPIQAGAAIVGPTTKGPLVPTITTTFSDYKSRFGSGFISGSTVYSYFTDIAAYNYFNQGGESLLVSRVVPERSNWTNATSSWMPVSGAFALVQATSSTNATQVNIGTLAYVSGSGLASKLFLNGGKALGYSITSASKVTQYQAPAFVLETLSYGDLTNNYQAPTTAAAITSSIFITGSTGILYSGSIDNVRWQIVGSNINTGTFSLVIRQGTDTTTLQSVVETFTNVSLDPTQPNYIEKVIGNQTQNIVQDASNGAYYIQTSGSFPNASRYIRVKQVNYKTPNYFDNAGTPKDQYTGSIPLPFEGVFGGASGNMLVNGTGSTPNNYYEQIGENTQGVYEGDYTVPFALLSNVEEYSFNIISAPGLTKQLNNTSGAVTSLMTLAQERGDVIAVVDLVNYNSTIDGVKNQAATVDTTYAAAYWPWVQTLDPTTGELVWVPASTLIPSVYAYSDKVGEQWFAPAGFSRGGMGTVSRVERKLSQSDKNSLAQSNINAIGTFPSQGPVVFGQNTLQKKASALGKVNVRRLLIALKSYIGQIADSLVFEQNTIATRNRFLSQVNPYLENVQQRQGLYSYKVVMDESNNTADVIDRNQLVGQIYIQPTITAEYVILDFNIQPTGVTFPN